MTSSAARLSAPLRLHQCFLLFLAGMVFTFVYSAPVRPHQGRRFLANLTIAIPRGCLLKVAAGPWWRRSHVEPWFIGGVFFLLLGASSTKDFSDMRGDEAAGCRTLPIRFGVERAARMIAPFFVVPWLLLPVGAFLPDPGAPQHAILTGNPWVLTALGLLLAAWGGYTVRLILRNPAALAGWRTTPPGRTCT